MKLFDRFVVRLGDFLVRRRIALTTALVLIALFAVNTFVEVRNYGPDEIEETPFGLKPLFETQRGTTFVGITEPDKEGRRWVAHFKLSFDFSPTALFISEDPELEYVVDYKEEFGQDDNFMVIMVESPHIFSTEFMEAVRGFSEQVELLDNVAEAVSLLDAPYAEPDPGGLRIVEFLEEFPPDEAGWREMRQKALDHPLYPGSLISREGDTVAVLIDLEDQYTTAVRDISLYEIELLVDEYLRPLPESVVRITGLPMVSREYTALLRGDQQRFAAIIYIVMAIVLFVLFRTAHGVYLPLSVIFMSMMGVFTVMILFDIPMNMVSSALPPLVMVIALSDGIHLIARYYEECAEEEDRHKALKITYRHILLALLLTSMTTAVGFGSLMSARIDIIQEFGMLAAVGVGIGFLVNVIAIPVALSLHGHPHPGQKKQLDSGILGRLLHANTDFVLKHPRGILIASAILMAVAGIGMSRLDINSRVLQELPPDNPLSQATVMAEEKLAGVLPYEIDFKSDAPGTFKDPDILRRLELVQRKLEEEPAVNTTLSIADIIKELNQATEGGDEAFYKLPASAPVVSELLFLYELSGDPDALWDLVTSDFQRARITGRRKDTGSDEFFEITDRINAYMDEVFAGTNVKPHVTGSPQIASRALDNMINDMLTSIFMAFIFIFAIMSIMLKSVRLGAMTMIPNILPMMTTMAVMGFAGINLRVSTVIIFSIALGIAVDDTIHIMARFREEFPKDNDYEAATRRTLLTSGRALVFTTAVLVLGFAVLITSEFVGLRDFAILGGCTLATALVADLLLLPALILSLRQRVLPLRRRARKDD